jgi:hypothetical protein
VSKSASLLWVLSIHAALFSVAACGGYTAPSATISPTPSGVSAKDVPVATQVTAPEPELPLGTTCPVDLFGSPATGPKSPRVWFRRHDPFCIVWRDAFANETGFRAVLRYNGGEEFIYWVAANVNEVYPPPSEWPDTLPRLPDDLNSPEAAGILRGLPRKDIQVTVYALTPVGEVIVDGFAIQYQ